MDALVALEAVLYWAGVVVLIVTGGGLLVAVAEVVVVAVWRIAKAWRAGVL